MKLKIISDGSTSGTKLINAATNEAIPFVQNIKFEADLNSNLVRAIIVVSNIEVDANVYNSYLMTEPKFIGKFPSSQNIKGWINCSECGNGYEVSKEDVACGDVIDKSSCDHCGYGIMKIDWDHFKF
jgi:hypothetical protein